MRNSISRLAHTVGDQSASAHKVLAMLMEEAPRRTRQHTMPPSAKFLSTQKASHAFYFRYNKTLMGFLRHSLSSFHATFIS